MKRLLFLATATCAASMSFAQANMLETPSNLALRLGIGFPLDKNARDITGNMIGVGADFFLKRALIPRANGESFVSFDWLGKSGSGAKGNMFPIMINQRWYSGPSAVGGKDGNRTYVFAGAGVSILDLTSTKTVFAMRAGGGIELGEKLFAEGNISYTEPNAGIRGSNIAFYIGYRF